MRLVCLLLQLTGLDRVVAASYGAQHQVNRQVEEANMTYCQEESSRLAQDMPAQDITVAKDETFSGGLGLVAMEPKRNSMCQAQGNVATTIIQTAVAQQCDAVMLGIPAGNAWSRLLWGLPITSILGQATLPVLLIPSA